jgi:hypothetical protein
VVLREVLQDIRPLELRRRRARIEPVRLHCGGERTGESASQLRYHRFIVSGICWRIYSHFLHCKLLRKNVVLLPLRMTHSKQYGTRVLSVGTIPELVSLRAQVLKWAGYDVVSTLKPLEAATRIRLGDGGILLLCYSVSEEWREALIGFWGSRRYR